MTTGRPGSFRWWRAHLAACLAVLLMLAGCAVAPEEIRAPGGAATPEAAVITFLRDLEAALRLEDPAITAREGRLHWARRLAEHFAPAERADQEVALAQMLTSFAANLRTVEPGRQVLVQFGGIDTPLVEPRDGDGALLRLPDGYVELQIVRPAERGQIEVLSQQRRPLAELVGGGPGIPLVQIDSRWYLTEASNE